MKVLLVGSGGREHALAWQLAQSDKCEALYAAPGNAGIRECAACVAIDAEDVEGLVSFAKDKEIDMVVVGPEAPLVKGLADRLREENILVFGPSAKAAQLEGSKGFMKDICAKYNIPTAAYGRFTNIEKAKAFIAEHGAPIVVKADGLAAGKGVIIAQSEDEAIAAAADMLSGNSFGAAGHEVVIEEFLDGEELSFFAICDGKTALAFGSAQDHKRAYDNDQGPNTGGMGAYTPAHMMTRELHNQIMDELITPTVEGMAAEGCPFTGVLFAGVMLVNGKPYLLEHNVRFGDPECQALMKRFDGDLLNTLVAAAQGDLEAARSEIEWRNGTALCVVMAAEGYPGSYAKNTVIKGLESAHTIAETTIFHAGTGVNDEGAIVNTGGRVLGVTALGENAQEAQSRAYETVALIDWPEGFCRKDIGYHAVAAEEERNLQNTQASA